MKTWQRAFVILLVLVSCIGCDQISKDLVQTKLRFAEPVALLGGVLHLFYDDPTRGRPHRHLQPRRRDDPDGLWAADPCVVATAEEGQGGGRRRRRLARLVL